MVLWEIALGTAWFLGLKRTHKLSLRLQRKLISPNHPKLRDFVQRRTRRVFDVALGVHLNLQQRKVQIGKSISNWIIRGLDRKKPLAATISGPRLIKSSNAASNIKKLMNNSANKVALQKLRGKSEQLFTVARNMWPKTTLPTVTMNKIMRPMRPAGSFVQNRQYIITGGTEHFTVGYGKFGFGDVVRNDIRQYLLCP